MTAVVKEYQPFVNSIYHIEGLPVNLTDLRNEIEDKKTDSSLWNNRYNTNFITDDQFSIKSKSYQEVYDCISPIAFDIIRIWGVTRSTKLLRHWTNRDKQHSLGFSHCHANSILSAIFYVTVPPKSGNIIFERPDNQEYAWMSNEIVNPYNCRTFQITPTENSALFFPSYIKHRIEPHMFNDTQERICISFDYGYSNTET
jgi:uncharacterized protein (TIGR02466 family)